MIKTWWYNAWGGRRQHPHSSADGQGLCVRHPNSLAGSDLCAWCGLGWWGLPSLGLQLSGWQGAARDWTWIKIDRGGASGARLLPTAITVPWLKQQLCFLLALSLWVTMYSCCQSSWKCHYLVFLRCWVWPSGAVFENRLVLWLHLPNSDYVLPYKVLPERHFSKKKTNSKKELKKKSDIGVPYPPLKDSKSWPTTRAT